MMMFKKSIALMAAMLGVAQQAFNSAGDKFREAATADQLLARGRRHENRAVRSENHDYGKPPTRSRYKPNHDELGRIGKRRKASSSARRANTHEPALCGATGVIYISYCSHDRLRRAQGFFS